MEYFLKSLLWLQATSVVVRPSVEIPAQMLFTDYRDEKGDKLYSSARHNCHDTGSACESGLQKFRTPLGRERWKADCLDVFQNVFSMPTCQSPLAGNLDAHVFAMSITRFTERSRSLPAPGRHGVHVRRRLRATARGSSQHPAAAKLRGLHTRASQLLHPKQNSIRTSSSTRHLSGRIHMNHHEGSLRVMLSCRQTTV